MGEKPTGCYYSREDPQRHFRKHVLSRNPPHLQYLTPYENKWLVMFRHTPNRDSQSARF